MLEAMGKREMLVTLSNVSLGLLNNWISPSPNFMDACGEQKPPMWTNPTEEHLELKMLKVMAGSGRKVSERTMHCSLLCVGLCRRMVSMVTPVQIRETEESCMVECNIKISIQCDIVSIHGDLHSQLPHLKGYAADRVRSSRNHVLSGQVGTVFVLYSITVDDLNVMAD